MTSCIDSGWLIVAIGPARRAERVREPRRAHVLGGDELALRDRDGALRNRDDVAGVERCRARLAATDRDRDRRRAARAACARESRSSPAALPAASPTRAARREAHVRSSSTISSSLYLREPFSRTTSSGRACSRSQRAACAFVPTRRSAAASSPPRCAPRASSAAILAAHEQHVDSSGGVRADAFVQRSATRRRAPPCSRAPRFGATPSPRRTRRAPRSCRSRWRCKRRR